MRRTIIAVLALSGTVVPLLAAGCFGGGKPAEPAPGGRESRVVILDPLEWSGRFLEANGLKVERREGAAILSAPEGGKMADVLAGALLALRRRMAVISENVAASETSRLPGASSAGAPQPYRRRVLNVTPGGVLELAADSASSFRKVYRPLHPDADKDGCVALPNVYVAVELSDFRASLREYEALRLALAGISARHAAPPAALLSAPVAPVLYYEERPLAPPKTDPPAPVPMPMGAREP